MFLRGKISVRSFGHKKFVKSYQNLLLYLEENSKIVHFLSTFFQWWSHNIQPGPVQSWKRVLITFTTIEVHNGSCVVKFIAVNLSIDQYILGKKVFGQQNIWVNLFGRKNIWVKKFLFTKKLHNYIIHLLVRKWFMLEDDFWKK